MVFLPVQGWHLELKSLSMSQQMLSTEEKLNLITRRQSFLEAADAESLKRLLQEKPKLKLAWETTPTGKRTSPSG